MTSPVQVVDVTCRRCAHEYEDWWRPSINLSLDPELASDDDYLEQASTTTCPRCGHREALATLLAEGGR